MSVGKREFKKQLGILDVTAITAGIVIGAGVFIIRACPKFGKFELRKIC